MSIVGEGLYSGDCFYNGVGKVCLRKWKEKTQSQHGWGVYSKDEIGGEPRKDRLGIWNEKIIRIFHKAVKMKHQS